MINRLTILTVITLALACRSFAATPLVVNQTYNSGYSGGSALAAGSGDLYFNLYSYSPSPALGTPVVASPDFGSWVQTGGAQWISPTENQVTGSRAGVYDYNSFLATDFLIPTTVTLTGSFAADSAATLYVNGISVQSVSAPAYTALTPISYTFTLGAGPDIIPIDFVVNNQATDLGGPVNPTGLLVSDLRVSTTAPEPGTYALLFAGLVVLAGFGRFRTASVRA